MDDLPPILLPPPPDDQGPPAKIYPLPPPGVRVLANGSGVNALGRFVSGPGAFGRDTSGIQSSAHASALARRRYELHRRRRQEAIVAAVAEALDHPKDKDAAQSFARAVADADADTFRVLWRDVVMGPKGRLRDRVVAYVRLAQVAGLPGVGDDKGEGADAPAVTITISGRALAGLAGLVGGVLGERG